MNHLGLFGLSFGLQLGVESFSLSNNRLVLVVPVSSSQGKTRGKANGDVGDDLSSQGAGDRSDSHFGCELWGLL